MTYRVFIGARANRVYLGTYRTKRQAINALFSWLNLRHFTMPESRDETRKAETQLLADSDRILRERFKPMPSGLHGPVYQFALGSICK